MKKRLLAMLLAAMLLLSLLVGCGGENAEAPAESAAAEAPVEETPAEEAPAEEVPAEAPAEEAPAEEITAEEAPAEEEPAFVPSEPLTYPLADGDVTFTILHAEPQLGPMSSFMPMTTYGDFETIAAGTEYIGVVPEWNSLSQMTADTQFNLIVASGDYPDVMCGVDKYYAGGLMKAYEEEVIITLDDYIADCMPEYWNLIHEDPTLLKAVTADNSSFMAWYSIFDKTIVNEGYFIRKDWCDLVGVDIPKSIDDMNNFAYAIKSELNLESVLLMGEGLDTLASAWGIAGTTASGSGFAYHREGDKLVADITSERYESYIRQLAQWYADGIVSRNFSELDTSNMSGTLEAELAANRTAIVSTMVNSMDNLRNDDPNFELVAMVCTVDGENDHQGQGERQFDSCSISSNCDEELIPYIMGWMDYWYTEEGAMAGSYGVEGLDYQVNDDGSITYLEIITENEYGFPPMLFSRARCFSGASFGLMYQDRTVPFFTEKQTAAIETWTSRTDDLEAIPQTLGLNSEESDVVALYATDLATYISEEVPKYVTGDRSFDTWGDFVAECEAMHVEELLAAYQAAYDRYLVK